MIIIFGRTQLTNVTSSKVDSIWCMPPSILILADHVYPVGGVSSKRLDFNCSVQREEVLHWGCVAPCLSPIRQVTASHPAHGGIIGRVQAIPYQPILILQSDIPVQYCQVREHWPGVNIQMARCRGRGDGAVSWGWGATWNQICHLYNTLRFRFGCLSLHSFALVLPNPKTLTWLSDVALVKLFASIYFTGCRNEGYKP